jgi:hypothetical protein
MAYKITDDCIGYGAGEAECKNGAIRSISTGKLALELAEWARETTEATRGGK